MTKDKSKIACVSGHRMNISERRDVSTPVLAACKLAACHTNAQEKRARKICIMSGTIIATRSAQLSGV